MSFLDRLATQHREVAQWLAGSQDYLETLPGLRERLEAGFTAADRGRLEASILELVGLNAFPEAKTQTQIQALWNSYFHRVFLGSIGFYPPSDANPLDELPPAISSQELAARARADEKLFPRLDFWRWILRKSYCEHFLEPFLDTAARTGLDLACGWGRASFALRNFNQRHLHCCDLAGDHLELLQRLAANAGLEQCLQVHRCDITRLPLENDSLDFVLAFDIFELLTDATLDVVIGEVLRCARPGAPVYCKVTLHAYRPSVGQVQGFGGAEMVQRFCAIQAHGKRLRVRRSAAALPEHKTFEVRRVGSRSRP